MKDKVEMILKHEINCFINRYSTSQLLLKETKDL